MDDDLGHLHEGSNVSSVRLLAAAAVHGRREYVADGRDARSRACCAGRARLEIVAARLVGKVDVVRSFQESSLHVDGQRQLLQGLHVHGGFLGRRDADGHAMAVIDEAYALGHETRRLIDRRQLVARLPLL